jgi:predicted anti-sigma-YlaC factor YlaD
MTPSRGQLCDRARQWASLKLDGELSELESALLDAHLARCEPCRGFAVEAQGIAGALRSVASEPLPAPIELDLHRRRAPKRVLHVSLVAALVLLAAALGSALGVADRGPGSRVAVPKQTAMIADATENLHALRRAQLIASGQLIRRNRFFHLVDS